MPGTLRWIMNGMTLMPAPIIEQTPVAVRPSRPSSRARRGGGPAGPLIGGKSLQDGEAAHPFAPAEPACSLDSPGHEAGKLRHPFDRFASTGAAHATRFDPGRNARAFGRRLGLTAGAGDQPRAPMTLTGEIVDISCYKQKGVAAGTGAAHVECAKICLLQKGAALGMLSDGDGLFRLWGTMARDKYAKLMPYVGQSVEITGTEVVLSNNYDVRSFEVQTIKARRKRTQ